MLCRLATICLAAALVGFCPGRASSETPIMEWSFATSVQNWRALGGGDLSALRSSDSSPSGDAGSLRVSGKAASNFSDYVTSSSFPISPGSAYRLRSVLRIDALGRNGAYPAAHPTFRIEFLDSRGHQVGQEFAPISVRRELGVWETQFVEFEAPPRAVEAQVRVSKMGKSEMAIDFSVDEVEVVRIDRESQHGSFFAHLVDGRLRRSEPAHPRLFLTPQRIDQIRIAVGLEENDVVDPVLVEMWRDLEETLADHKGGRVQPKQYDDLARARFTGQRFEANILAQLSFAYAISKDPAYYAAAERYARSILAYPTWGGDGVSLPSGHLQFGLAVFFDWCFAEISKAPGPNGDGRLKDAVLSALQERGAFVFNSALMRRGATWWARSPRNNQAMIHVAGVGISGFAIFDEDNASIGGTQKWIGFALDQARNVNHVNLPASTCGDPGPCAKPDGFTNEGLGYWAYGAESMLKFMYVAQELLGIDLHHAEANGEPHPWWKSTARARIYLGTPMNSWQMKRQIVDLGDAQRRNWYGPDYILRRLAHLYQDPVAQWAAAAISGANPQQMNFASTTSQWLNLVWYDPEVSARSPIAEAWPGMAHLEDFGVVSARNAWDGDESLVVMKTGPAQGHLYFQLDPPIRVGGKAHRDANHFVIYGDGKWLIRDGSDDHSTRRDTAEHNTLLIDGRGQLETDRPTRSPRIVEALSTSNFDYVVGDATRAYEGAFPGEFPQATPLKHFVRHLVFLKTLDAVLVLDDISLEGPADLELRFHTETPIDPKKLQGECHSHDDFETCLSFDLLTPKGVKTRTGMEAGLDVLRLQRRDRHWQNAMLISWSPQGTNPTQARLLYAKGSEWKFEIADVELEIDIESRRVRWIEDHPQSAVPELHPGSV